MMISAWIFCRVLPIGCAMLWAKRDIHLRPARRKLRARQDKQKNQRSQKTLIFHWFLKTQRRGSQAR
jgi:hypothetical protein